MEQIATFLQEQLGRNEILSGGVVLMLLGAVLHQCRAIPAQAWEFLVSRCSVTVDLREDDEAFRWLSEWLARQPYSRDRARRLTVRTLRDGEGGLRVLFIPAMGGHWFLYRGRLVHLSRNKDRDGGGPGHGGGMSSVMREQIFVTIYTRDRALATELIAEARRTVEPPHERRMSILVYRWDDWTVSTRKRPRPVESVVLRAGLLEELLGAVGRFLDGEEWYVARGIPYRLGILLTGPPGSGKSSAVAAVAGHFGLDVAILSLTRKDQTDESLRVALSDVPPRTVVLIEDVDCVFCEREATQEKDNGLSFSGLLNAIDGVAAGEGRILFMTTNHPDRLDPALIRPGRVDLAREIGRPDADQARRMFLRFFPGADDEARRFAARCRLASMAAIQNHLLEHAHDAAELIESLEAPAEPSRARQAMPAPQRLAGVR